MIVSIMESTHVPAGWEEQPSEDWEAPEETCAGFVVMSRPAGTQGERSVMGQRNLCHDSIRQKLSLILMGIVVVLNSDGMYGSGIRLPGQGL